MNIQEEKGLFLTPRKIEFFPWIMNQFLAFEEKNHLLIITISFNIKAEENFFLPKLDICLFGTLELVLPSGVS